MKTYRIIHYYTSTVTYEIEADSSDQARDIVNGFNPPKPVDESGNDFSDETIDEIV